MSIPKLISYESWRCAFIFYLRTSLLETIAWWSLSLWLKVKWLWCIKCMNPSCLSNLLLFKVSVGRLGLHSRYSSQFGSSFRCQSPRKLRHGLHKCSFRSLWRSQRHYRKVLTPFVCNHHTDKSYWEDKFHYLKALFISVREIFHGRPCQVLSRPKSIFQNYVLWNHL
jgi:hypothetical protein